MKRKKSETISVDELKAIMGSDYNLYITNCFCGSCDQTPTTIVDFTAEINDISDILLKGKCANCGAPVNRYLETGENPESVKTIENVLRKRNLKIIKRIRECSGAKSVLALKCFSTWSVFDLMKPYMDGTTSSSLYEARLGYEKFGKETQVYSVGYSQEDVKKLSAFVDKIIFNSLSQLEKFYPYARSCKIGLRLNPRVSYSHFDLADPARKFSRLE